TSAHSVIKVLPASFISERLNRIYRRGSSCWVERREDSDCPQKHECQQSYHPSGQQSRKEIRHRQQVDKGAQAEGHGQSDSTADQCDEQRFHKELLQNFAGRSAQSLAHADFTRSLAYGY